MADQNPYKWTQKDAVALRTFIASNPKFLHNLRKRIPEITGTTMEARAVTGSDANGFMLALTRIDIMQTEYDPERAPSDIEFVEDN